MENIQKMMPITTITAITPTTAPALNIPVTTEQLLMATITNSNNDRFNFFIIDKEEKVDIVLDG
ncbi:hypothetical protein Mucpa_1612 [Mucilaginibacter paludis DSM 18603]|uniref:Uncharacterized protein n=1 Tax=Mucilaginibacter paludis DSM 18603 TaxID=714943 RepID=H1Y4D5_9SPHI|nr:hypothetical protein Mucpa_1612 [Mucilaginibacter paludis DSM 18603]